MASNALQYKHPKATNDCSTQHVNQKPEDTFILSSLPAPTPLNFHSCFTHWASFFSVSLPTYSFCPHFPPCSTSCNIWSRLAGVVDAAVVPHLWSVFIRNGPYYLDSIHAEFMLSRWWRLSCGQRAFGRKLLVERYVITHLVLADAVSQQWINPLRENWALITLAAFTDRKTRKMFWTHSLYVSGNKCKKRSKDTKDH